MTYQTPQLQLIGSAKGIVLGFNPRGIMLFPDNGIGTELSREAVWS